MRFFCFLLGVFLSSAALSHSASGGAIALFFEAEKDVKAGQKEEALTKYKRVIELAREEKLLLYEASAAKNLAFEMNRRAAGEDTLRYAQIACEAYQSGDKRGESWTRKPWAKLGHLMSAGLVERGYYHEGRLGMAWQANHEAYRLWLRKAGVSPRGTDFDSKNLHLCSENMVSPGLRFHEREAEYLHFVGRTQEALDLLAESIAAVNPASLQRDAAVRGYHRNLLTQQAGIHGFIGEEELAIASLRKQIESMQSDPLAKRSSLIARLNLLHERMDIEDLSENDYQEAEEIAKEVRALENGGAIDLDRTLAAIFRHRKSHEERLKLLEAGANSPSALSAFYAERELLFARSAAGEAGLESEYFALLAEIRKKGNKRAEPRVYRRYGDWLSTQGRWSEARNCYRESLRMTLLFGWPQRVPELKERLAGLYLMEGDEAAARMAWEEADRYYRVETELNPRQIVKAWRLRLWDQLRAGLTEEATALAKRALEFGQKAGLAENLLMNFQGADLAALIQVLGGAGFVASSEKEERGEFAVRLQPSLVKTVAEAEGKARAVFYLINSSDRAKEGELVLQGKSPLLAVLGKEGGVSVSVGALEGAKKVTLPLTLQAGALREVLVVGHSETVACDDDGNARLSIAWQEKGQEGQTSQWQFSWGERATEFAVLDAMEVSGNPFEGLPLRHHFAIPESVTAAVPVRLRLESMDEGNLYLEYRSPASGEVLAADANGDGDFTGPGEFCEPVADGQLLCGPLVGDRKRGLEVWLFHSGDKTASHEGELVIEYYKNGQWQETGRNTFRFATKR